MIGKATALAVLVGERKAQAGRVDPALAERAQTCDRFDAIQFSRTATQGFTRPGSTTSDVPFENADRPHATMMRNFVGAILDGEPLIAPGAEGISKISIQTGTSHGGVPLPDGSIAQVSVDFGALETISRIARERYGLGGAVQHGASTLPAELFGKFPELGACEIHLATEFQNMLFDHPAFPVELKRDIYERIFHAVVKKMGMNQCPEAIEYLYDRYYLRGRTTRASDCRDLLETVQSICRFRKQPVQLTRDLIAEAATSFICEFQ